MAGGVSPGPAAADLAELLYGAVKGGVRRRSDGTGMWAGRARRFRRVAAGGRACPWNST